MIEPHYPKIILSFAYRGAEIQIDRGEFHGREVYAAWVNYERGCAVAVPSAVTSSEAVRRAKRWIDTKLKPVEAERNF